MNISNVSLITATALSLFSFPKEGNAQSGQPDSENFNIAISNPVEKNEPHATTSGCACASCCSVKI